MDIATAETMRFLGFTLPPTGANILQIGVGTGELALALQTVGHSVITLDACPQAVERACAKGVHALTAEWPAYDGERVDVVVFACSLHQMDDLDLALNRAVAMIRPGGHVIVEDFDYLELNEKSSRWFSYQLELLTVTGLLSCPDDSFLAQCQMMNGGLEAWSRDQELHTAAAMIQAMRRRMMDVTVERAPYLYRFLIPGLVNSRQGTDLLATFLELERTMGRYGWIPSIGRRMVGTVIR